MTKVNIEDAKNYKKCAKKSYEVSACIPAQGTLIINKLEQAALYKKLGNKSYFTNSKLSFVTPQSGHTQSSGISSNFVPGAMPESGSPTSGS